MKKITVLKIIIFLFVTGSILGIPELFERGFYRNVATALAFIIAAGIGILILREEEKTEVDAQ